MTSQGRAYEVAEASAWDDLQKALAELAAERAELAGDDAPAH